MQIRRLHWRLPLRAALSACLATAVAPLESALAQSPSDQRISLVQAIEAARQISPDVRAAREGVAAAAARARQAGAYPNPVLSYAREQTSSSGQSNSQNLLGVEQRVELGPARSARAAAARGRHEIAMARLQYVEAQLDFGTVRAYVLAAAAGRRAILVDQVASAFAQAVGVSERRLVAGDVSGYAHRRIRLEAARYAVLRAEAQLERRAAFLLLATFVSAAADSIPPSEFELTDSLPTVVRWQTTAAIAAQGGTPANRAVDSLVRLALRARADVRAQDLEMMVARAEAQLVVAERVPAPAVSLGFKNERVAGVPGTANGFTAGISLPIPLWDRRAGAVAAANADLTQRAAEAEAYRRRVVREVVEAFDGYAVLAAQLDALRPQLGPESANALRAVQVAYSEGEITLVEWLDAVRAYQEVESSYITLRAEAVIRRAALALSIGAPPATIDPGVDTPERN